ncbi:ATPase family AAA domain-containing 5 [Pelobates cultripes]|uniref:ATPase family AAA domain-containing 5 n=1 Tax=Pelobates cultripes TaxID=61616 RepID=A0AAD1RSX4_PELCU|nr:ATPase family AAA domain-containing 5 [Pelobates cultripes]
MAGMLAVSPSIAEYSVPPCKKMRKDDDHPIKTITNYFSPVSKIPEKVLSSPRSSNIADYFKKCSPTTKTSSPNQDSSQKNVTNNQTPPTSKEPGKLRKRGKRTSLSKKLNDVKPENESDAVDATETVCTGTGFMGSDTAALLAEICSKKDEFDEKSKLDISTNTKSPASSETRVSSKSRKRKPDNSVKSSNFQAVQPDVSVSEDSSVPIGNSLQTDNTSIDLSFEVNTRDNSHNTSSTVTVSFEEFLKSQEEATQDVTSDSKRIETDCPENDSTGNSAASENRESAPNTMTVHAQIHLTPLLHSASTKNKKSKKIAAIFLKKGDLDAKDNQHSSEPEQADHVFQKRKSNVVILEEDLELAVLEVENGEPLKQKSTEAERQQFMKAFKQPGDMPKCTGKKSLGKKKDSDEVLTPVASGCEKRHDSETDVVVLSTGKKEESQQKKKSGEQVTSLKLKKRVKKVKPNTDANTETKTQVSERKTKKTSSTPTDEQSVSPAVGTGLRRSTRYRKSDTSPLKSPLQETSKVDAPVLMSTPKVKTPCRKGDVYRAEVITIPSDTESPIRMRFTKLTRRRYKGHSAEDEVFTPKSKKVSVHAKKLIEKAKAIQKNIATAETPRRRSSRHWPEKKSVLEAPANNIDITRERPSKSAKKKNLRSLNDVLGKKAKVKNCDISSGKRKSSVKNPSLITVIDDSSEVSESSEDNEQFKAKREFLMSGLPDSLKRHISKTAAFMEAYSLSSSSFQTVVHVQQKDSCPMWNLNMPSCPRLTLLEHIRVDIPNLAKNSLSLGDFTSARTEHSVQFNSSLVTSRAVLSDVIRNCLLEEICASGALFPVKRFLQQFLKKQSDQLQEASKQVDQLLERKLGEVILVEDSESPENNRTKRKRKESIGTKFKRIKSANTEECYDKPLPTPEVPKQRTSRGSLSRTSKKQQVESKVQSPIEEKPPAVSDVITEDVLWTEKYQPLNSTELVGNSAAIKRLHSWLKDWKIRAEKEEKRSRINKTEKDKNDTWGQSDFTDNSDSDDDESLCNTMLICGPPGVGKTAAVYACAQELGFKVFEVNASCQRSGRQILTQLKEATQSHQVDQQGVNAHKPCFFNSHGTTKSPRKFNSPKHVISSPRKPPGSPRGAGFRKGLAPKSLANYFKVPVKQKSDNSKTQEVSSKSETIVVEESANKTNKNQVPATEKGNGSDESQRKTATSLILFEEVDVIFDDDSGFLSAIKTFMATTKRPVILTTSDHTFDLMFDGIFEKIVFHTPSIANVASYLRVLCLAENLRTDSKDFATFLAANRCDIRQSVLHLQYWATSGGGGLQEKPLALSCKQDGNASGKDGKDVNPDDIPKCNSGCAENAIGLNNIVSPAEGLICFVKNNISHIKEQSRIIQLLTEFQTKRIHFIASNLEFLLPLPLHVMESKEQLFTNISGLESLDLKAETVDESPIKVSVQMKRKKQLFLLNDSDLFDSDSIDEVLSLPSDNLPPKENDLPTCGTPVSLEQRKLTETEKKQSGLVHQCLGSVAEFVDNMSFLDCFTYHATERAEFRHSHWTESRIKNGLCDELRTESSDWWSGHSSVELKATLEALSFHKCSSGISKVIDFCKESGEDLSKDLTVQVSKERETVSFGQPSIYSDVAERRLSVVRSVLSSKSFLTLGNRRANVTEYLPALRNICRFQRLKEQEKTKRRFLHYFEGIHLELPKHTMSSLAADFP